MCNLRFAACYCLIIRRRASQRFYLLPVQIHNAIISPHKTQRFDLAASTTAVLTNGTCLWSSAFTIQVNLIRLIAAAVVSGRHSTHSP